MQRYAGRLRIYKYMEAEKTQLLKECRQGKRLAQLSLYKQYAQRLYMTCLRIVNNAADAEEAMQDSFLKILTRLDQYHEAQSFDAWIKQIAIHTAIDYVRRKTPEWEELHDNVTAEENDSSSEEELEYSVKQVKEGMTKLADGYRLILSLYLFEGYDTEEIAEILHIQPPSVRSQYMRAKRKLIEIIGDKIHGQVKAIY